MKDFGKKKTNFVTNTVKRYFLLDAHADDGNSAPPIDYEKLIAKARQEEKDKLYPEIQKLKAQVEALTQQSNDNLLAKGKAEAEVDSLRKQLENGQSEEVTKLTAKIEALEEENKKLKESATDETKIREELQKEFEVKEYARDKILESQQSGKLLKAFSKNVTGKTKEEIDAALAEAIKASDEVRAEVGGGKKDDEDSKDSDTDNKDKDKGGKEKDKKDSDKGGKKKNESNNPPAPNPNSFTVGGKEYTREYIQSLDVTSEEYKKFRKEVLGLK